MLLAIHLPLCDEAVSLTEKTPMLPWILGGVALVGIAALILFLRNRKK